MAGLLDFLFSQQQGGARSISPLGLLSNAFPQAPYESPPETQAIQQQLDRTQMPPQASGLLDPSPMGGGGLMPQGMPLQPPTQGFAPLMEDLPAQGASPTGAAPMPPQSPMQQQGPMPGAPMQLPGAASAMPPMQAGPGSPQQRGQSGFDKFFDVIGSIYGKGGPGDNLIALGAGLASGGGNWGQGLMRGMSMINANQMTAKKREDEQRRQQGQMTLAQEIERRTKGQIPASVAIGAIQSGAGGQLLQDAFKSRAEFRTLTDPSERAKMGIPQNDTGVYQVDNQGRIVSVGKPQTNINMNSENAFDKAAGGKLAETYSKIVDAGDTAAARTTDLSALRDISGRIGNQGSTANFKLLVGPMANALGVKVDGLSDLQAWNSIITRLAPQMRAPGSGATSDIEYKGFIQSLPQASQSPEARGMIIETMDAMARDAVARREVALKVLSKQITREDADAALKALPNPFDTFKQWQQATGQAKQSDSPPAPGARKAPDGNWYVQQNGQWFKVQQ